MTKRTLQIISLGLLAYLLVDTFLHLNIAGDLNRHLTEFKKDDIDTLSNIDAVKTEAKKSVDTIHRLHQSYKTNSWTRLLAVFLVIVFQIMVFTWRDKSPTKKQQP